jgi:hypothetical protein
MGESTRERKKGPKEWNMRDYEARSEGAKGCKNIAEVGDDQLLWSIVARSQASEHDPF